MKQFIGVLLAVIAFVWVIGSAGALECDNITILQCLVQSGIGFAVAWLGLKLANFEGEEK